MTSRTTRFSSQKSITLRNLLLIIILALLSVFTYKEYSRSITSIYGFVKAEINVIQRCQVAFIFEGTSAECSIVEFTKNLVHSLKRTEDFNSYCSLHVFALQRNGQSFKSDFSESFVTDIFIDDQRSSEGIESLMKYINENGFTSVIIPQGFEVASNMGQLTDLGSKLSSNILIYYVLYFSLDKPSLQVIGLVRHMANHAAHLIVMIWFDYHSLIHTYGIQENKILNIPHGISTPKLMKTERNLKSIETLLKYSNQDFVLLSTGPIHSNKDFKRLILNLKLIIAKIANLHLLILGRESVTNTSIIPNILETVKYLTLEGRITWINRCMSMEELDVVYKRANAYISTCGNLLNAMAYALPIISTPDIFAIETLKHDRGLIVSFDNDKVLVESISEFLKNRTLMRMFSNNAREFIQKLTWDNIAKQYAQLFKTRLFTNLEVKKYFTRELIDDPYENEPVLADIEEPVYWTNNGAMSFDHQDVFSSLKAHKAESGIYTIYSDSFLQLNGKINKKYQIETIGLKTPNQYVIIDRNKGIEEFKINKQNFTSQIQIEYTKQKLIFTSININFEISHSPNEITIHFFKVNRFTTAFGLIGSTLGEEKLSVRNISTQTIRPLKWFISGQDIFSHSCEGQRLSMFGMEHNVFILPENTLLQCSRHKSRKVKLIMEGSFFRKSGFASVNRKIFLSLMKNEDFVISIRPIDKTVQPNEISLETLLVYTLFLRQDAYKKTYRNSVFHQLTCYKDKTIIFRNSWPPNLRGVSNKEILIHQQPWEFHAIPTNWLEYFQHKIHELWVPSRYGKSSFISNGVNDSKIYVIPHGIFMEKYKLKVRPLALPTNKTFKFLFVGGTLRRKGIDLLLDAYKTLFSRKDDVTLIIHSTYKDASGSGIMTEMKPNSTYPEIINIGDTLSDIDMIRLFKSVDVYVSPYRGEGFGLTILEAMASGLPPIVTKYGPSLDFCPEECAYFVEAQVTECLTYPCGKMKIFGSETVIQPMWAEPNVQSLSAMMYRAYTDRVELRKKSSLCQKYAEHYTWDKVADKMIQRLSQINQ